MSSARKTAPWLGMALAASLAACGPRPDSGSATSSIPDAAALTLEVTGGSSEQAVTPAAAADLAAVSGTAWPETGDDLALAQKKIAALNSAIRSIFDHVEGVALVDKANWPAATGRWYGPSDRCAVDVSPCPDGDAATFRLWVGQGQRGMAFVLEAKPVGADDATFAAILAGWMKRGALARRGVGQIWVNLQNLKLAAAAYPGQGYLYGGFAAGPKAKVAVYRLLDFTPDATSSDPDLAPATVFFRGFKNGEGTARVRVAALKDYVPTTGDDELGLFHVVYNPGLGGRAYAVVADYTSSGVTHGDVPAGDYFFGRSCYAPHAPGVPVFKEWFLCPLDEGPAACAASGGLDKRLVTGTTWAAECAGVLVEASTAFGAPTGVPDADPAAAPGALPGEDSSGLTPEDAPATTDAAPTAG
ncbi:MAG TPA: hypothetical protein VMU15_07920 [Anaeromyxobacter sp.]|nr:hypothetical protein [Anaeromyxobacter sp.]